MGVPAEAAAFVAHLQGLLDEVQVRLLVQLPCSCDAVDSSVAHWCVKWKQAGALDEVQSVLVSTAFIEVRSPLPSKTQAGLLADAAAFRDQHIVDVKTYDELKEAIAAGACLHGRACMAALAWADVQWPPVSHQRA